ncbi:hypothetical protein G7Y79_00003g009680 [Physcia stellaris]|nr:hypothetical protein G7Y79_00003g009680 [Physcia stellaris]
MPPVTKRCKPRATANPISSTLSQQRGIQAFGKISKAQVDRGNTGKSKEVDGEQSVKAGAASAKLIGKRKRQSRDASSDGENPSQPAAKSQRTDSPVNSLSQYQAQTPVPSLQRKTPRKKTKVSLATTETPTKGARAILESFSLQPSSPSIRSSSPPRSRTTTPPTSPASFRSATSESQKASELPSELEDLIDLYASFLTALSLHYAHHGSLTPVDLRELCPSIARTWRKRAVSVEDVQRILAIAQQDLDPGVRSLSLFDYGHGKICLEVLDCPFQGIHRRLVDDEALNETFCHNLELRWESYITSAPSPRSVAAFISTLPLLPIGICTSLSKLTPLLAKGQRRLEDLKAGAIRAQKSSSLATSPVQDRSSKRPQLASRSGSLLDRIRAKELVQSTLPPPPSAAMLERKSSLHRLEEVVPVLELLTSGTISRVQQSTTPLGNPQLQTQTQSFTMSTLVQNLQMSLRNPISKDDAVRCIRLLAEIVPGWVGVREVGKCIGVTVRRGGAVGRDEVDRRVRRMLEKM